MFTIRALILLALCACEASDSPGQVQAAAVIVPPDPGPKLCAAICSSNVECRSPVTLCRFCNFGSCSQTLPEVTVRALSWMRQIVVERADDPDAEPAMRVLDGLLIRARRTAAEP
jgi:hypothetical protein